MIVVWICLFCTLNVTVGLLDLYLVCKWHINSLAALNVLTLCFVVPILSYTVSRNFLACSSLAGSRRRCLRAAVHFLGPSLVHPCDWCVGSQCTPHCLTQSIGACGSGLPNIWCQLAVFVIYWGLLIGRIFWQDGGVPDDDVFTGYLRAASCP